jgi:predicted SprT family Zn-dependent metalloprotease
MGVAYSSPDSAYTRITVVYRCRCGAVASEVGRHAAEGPDGWEQAEGEAYICAHCAELKHAGALPPSPASA